MENDTLMKTCYVPVLPLTPSLPAKEESERAGGRASGRGNKRARFCWYITRKKDIMWRYPRRAVMRFWSRVKNTEGRCYCSLVLKPNYANRSVIAFASAASTYGSSGFYWRTAL